MQVTSSSKLSVFIAGALVGGLVAWSGGDVRAHGGDHAAPKQASAQVRSARQLCTQTAPSKKARMTRLAQGDHAFMALLELDPSARVPKHRDATEEYLYVLAGSGKLTIDGVTSSIAAGTSVMMPANAEVHFENGPSSLIAVQVFAGPGPAKKYDSWTGCAGGQPR